jgi:4-amino-4-deoxy-L-arabinose transferase-like glycosyltransferase
MGRIGMLLDPSARGHPDDAALDKRTAMLLLTAVLGVLLLPFVNIAFHIDDPLFIWAADHIRRNPANPYAFTVNWYGTDMAMSDVTKNPPLASYYMTLAAFVVGWGEVGLHLAFLLPALAAVIGMYLIAARMCRHPLLAALVGLLTPVFLVSGLTVMSDMIMLAFWVFAVHWWMKGVETKSHGWFVLAAVLMTLAALSKYFGMTLIPLLFVYSVAKERRARMWMLYFLIPVAVLAWYQWITARLYGHGLLIDAASYATEQGGGSDRLSMTRTLVTLAFTGGCVASVAFFSRRLWSGRALLLGLAIAIATALFAQSWSKLGSFNFPADEGARQFLCIQIGLWAAAGVSLACLATLDLWRARDAESLLLFLWIAGTFVFAGFVNWSTNGRSILPMVVPAGILVARRLELNAIVRGSMSLSSRVMPLAASAVVALAVVWADYKFADTARTGATLIHQKYSAGAPTTWFQGHWGFQYYMQQLGAKPVERMSRYTPGDVIAIPTTNTGRFMMPEWAVASGVIAVPSSRWLATMSGEVGAGFYADAFGPLPFVVGVVPDEQFTILNVRP